MKMKTGDADSASHAQLTVVFIARYYYPFIGGIEKQVPSQAAALRRSGIRVAVVTGRFSNDFPRVERTHGVPVYRLPSPRIKIIGALVFLLHLIGFLYRRRTRYSALHVFQVGYCSAVAAVLGRLLNIPVFLHLAGSGRGGDIFRHLKTPWGWLFLALCRLASNIVVLNPEMLQELKAIFYSKQRAFFIPNAVDAAYYRPARDRAAVRQALAIPESRTVVLYTGRLAAEKGVGVLVRAFALTCPTIDTCLYLVGSGREYRRLKRQTHHLCLGDRVQFIPACSDVRQYYQCADIFVMPSLHEGMSNSVLEAMACALPVIATAVSGTTELLRDRHAGLLVPPREPKALAGALLTLLHDPAARAAMGYAGRSMVKDTYTDSHVLQGYLQMYESTGLSAAQQYRHGLSVPESAG